VIEEVMADNERADLLYDIQRHFATGPDVK
jgi:hypothetical protein